MEILLITQARLGSSRFPNKILQQINGKTLLEIHLNRVIKSKYVTKFVVASTFENQIEIVKNISEINGFDFFQGSTNDVLDRFYQCSKNYKVDYIVRVTSDCPLIDSSLLDEVIEFTLKNKLDYGANILLETFPDGQDIEVFKKNVLKEAWLQSESLHEKEHVTPYIRNNSSYLGGSKFKSENFLSVYNYNDIRMTVDEYEDLKAIDILIKKLGLNRKWKEYAKFIEQNQDLFNNQFIERNEGYFKSLNNESK